MSTIEEICKTIYKNAIREDCSPFSIDYHDATDAAYVNIPGEGTYGEDIISIPVDQALALHDWLGLQRFNLEDLQNALQAKRIEDASTKEQREAERVSALKAKHSDAVSAWQQGGCVGPCPSFEEIANPKVEFIMKFPVLEMLRKRQINANPAIPLQYGVETPIHDAIKASAMLTREAADRVAHAELAGHEQPPRFRPPVLAEAGELYSIDLGGYHGSESLEVLQKEQEDAQS